MQPDKTNMDDLDYLAQQGFEKVAVSDADVDALVKKVHARSFSYNSGVLFGLTGLIAGIFIGITLFVLWHDQVAAPAAKAEVSKNSAPLVIKQPAQTILLDTFTVVKENFIAARPRRVPAVETNAESPAMQTDSVMSIPEKPIDLALFNKEPVQENKLKFINNAPVVYIHDLKVTNYTLLYFKNNRFVKINERPGVSANYAASGGAVGTSLKQSADYFLHEELAQALLYFKKARYDACLVALNNIATYNASDINCDFYRGMCYYYKHNTAKAIEFFDACISDLNNTFLQEAQFYKATALSDSGNKAAAQALFKQIAEDDGFYTEKAKLYLK